MCVYVANFIYTYKDYKFWFSPKKSILNLNIEFPPKTTDELKKKETIWASEVITDRLLSDRANEILQISY